MTRRSAKVDWAHFYIEVSMNASRLSQGALKVANHSLLTAGSAIDSTALPMRLAAVLWCSCCTISLSLHLFTWHSTACFATSVLSASAGARQHCWGTWVGTVKAIKTHQIHHHAAADQHSSFAGARVVGAALGLVALMKALHGMIASHIGIGPSALPNNDRAWHESNDINTCAIEWA